MSKTLRKILIADDDPEARQIAILSLCAMDVEIIEAKDGLEAINLYRSSLPELIVLDLMMPGCDGAQACAEIKKLSVETFVPVIMLTACMDVDDKVRLFAAGADDYLTKPFHASELEARVRALFRIRDLTLSLIEKNLALVKAQGELVEKERQLTAHQLAGTAAHQLGQPLSAIMLSSHLLTRLPSDDSRFQQALQTIEREVERMGGMIEDLKKVDASKTESYYEKVEVFGSKRNPK